MLLCCSFFDFAFAKITFSFYIFKNFLAIFISASTFSSFFRNFLLYFIIFKYCCLQYFFDIFYFKLSKQLFLLLKNLFHFSMFYFKIVHFQAFQLNGFNSSLFSVVEPRYLILTFFEMICSIVFNVFSNIVKTNNYIFFYSAFQFFLSLRAISFKNQAASNSDIFKNPSVHIFCFSYGQHEIPEIIFEF